jgi:hypothetical protein
VADDDGMRKRGSVEPPLAYTPPSYDYYLRGRVDRMLYDKEGRW